jgi:hypothetical protein
MPWWKIIVIPRKPKLQQIKNRRARALPPT